MRLSVIISVTAFFLYTALLVSIAMAETIEVEVTGTNAVSCVDCDGRLNKNKYVKCNSWFNAKKPTSYLNSRGCQKVIDYKTGKRLRK